MTYIVFEDKTKKKWNFEGIWTYPYSSRIFVFNMFNWCLLSNWWKYCWFT
jgi:hypothetical protein